MRTNLDRRHFLGLAGLGAGAAALTACGGPSTAGPGTAVESAAVDFTNVKPAASFDFWTNHPGKSQDVEKAIISKFQAKFPDIKVNLMTAGANYEEIAQKFQTSQAAKTGLPGLVVLSDVWWFRYFSNGSIIPIDNLVKQLDIQLDDFQKSWLTTTSTTTSSGPCHTAAPPRFSTTTKTTSRPQAFPTGLRQRGRNSPSGLPN